MALLDEDEIRHRLARAKGWGGERARSRAPGASPTSRSHGVREPRGRSPRRWTITPTSTSATRRSGSRSPATTPAASPFATSRSPNRSACEGARRRGARPARPRALVPPRRRARLGGRPRRARRDGRAGGFRVRRPGEARRGLQRHRLEPGGRGRGGAGARLRRERARPAHPRARGLGRRRAARARLDRLRLRRLVAAALQRERRAAPALGLRRLEARGRAERPRGSGAPGRAHERRPGPSGIGAEGRLVRRPHPGSGASRRSRCASSRTRPSAPTFADELALALLALARSAARGSLHVANAGSCSWHELAVASLRAAGIDAPVAAISCGAEAPARRPMYSVLDTSRHIVARSDAAARLEGRARGSRRRVTRLAAQQPEHPAQQQAQQDRRHDREVERDVAALHDDVAGKPAERRAAGS